MRTRHYLCLLAAAAALAACKGDKSDAAVITPGEGTLEPAQRPTTAANPDAVVITSENGAVSMGLGQDAVWMQLSDSVRQLASAKLARDSAASQGRDKGSALGAMIERTVKQSVHSMLNKRIDVPLSSIEDVRYEDGEIVFDYAGSRPLLNFESVKVDDRKVLQSFPPDEAQRFVAAVRAAKRSQ
jgi:hypothetical protein